MKWFEEIIKTSNLRGKRILLGIGGGIAAYKSVELLRIFQKAGVSVRVVMTHTASKFIGKELLEALTGEKVFIDMEGMEHITVPHSVDLFVVAPATANLIGKFANGICDSMLTTMFIASTSPCVIVPSMNWAMLKNPATQENIRKLRERGYIVVEPEEGDLACGEKGEGRYPSFERIFFWCEYALSQKNLSGRRVIVTAGPTKEFIDDIRFISNSSSGFMGYLVAREFSLVGAEVKLITGGDIFDSSEFCSVSRVISADDMYDEVMRSLPADVFVGTSAVSDFTPARKVKGKIKKESIEGDKLIVELKKTKDIISDVDCPVKIGFSLEVENIKENSVRKLREKKLDFVVANSTDSFGGEKGNFTIFYFENGELKEDKLGLFHKREVARKLVELSFRKISGKV